MIEPFEKCIGCGNLKDLTGAWVCGKYSNMEAQWRRGNCAMSTHVKKQVQGKEFVDPLKASKQRARGKA